VESKDDFARRSSDAQYNTEVVPTSGISSGRAPAPESSLQAPLARKALAGFFLSGLLFAFLGAILPAWRHHLAENYLTVGNYFLSMNVGILASLGLARWVLGRRSSRALLVIACSMACASFVYLALIPTGAPESWRMIGTFGLGAGAGLLNRAVFQAISAVYRHDPAATTNLSGTFFGLGSVVIAILVAGTFYAYTVASILVFIALIPGFFAIMYARSHVPFDPPAEASWSQTVAGLKSPGAVLFTLLLFFQFGNEWSIAGWLPLFLIQRIGISPESSLLMLAVYWMALLVGRVVVQALLPGVSHGKLLMSSVVAAMFGCTVLLATNNSFGAVSGILLVGGGFASVYPLVVEKIGGRFPNYHPGLYNGLFSFALSGGLIAPWSLGFFADRWGIQVVMGLPLLGTLMVFMLLLAIWAEAKLMATR
jgi:FHS family glucose/mannose:H+ symporter-like MFS transporter